VFHLGEYLELDLLMLFVLKSGGEGDQGKRTGEKLEHRYNQVESESLYFYIMYAFTFRIHG
jgi:hypothetical protein